MKNLAIMLVMLLIASVLVAHCQHECIKPPLQYCYICQEQPDQYTGVKGCMIPMFDCTQCAELLCFPLNPPSANISKLYSISTEDIAANYSPAIAALVQMVLDNYNSGELGSMSTIDIGGFITLLDVENTYRLSILEHQGVQYWSLEIQGYGTVKIETRENAKPTIYRLNEDLPVIIN